MAGLVIAAHAAKRGLVHRIKKMLKPVARLVNRSSPKAQVPPQAPTQADLDNLANEALEQKLYADQNAANEERVRVLLHQLAAVSSPCRCAATSDADLWPTASTLSRCQRAEQQRPF